MRDDCSFRKAFSVYQSYDYATACDLFDTYLRDHDPDWRAKLWYARALSELEAFDAALTVLEAVVDANPRQDVARTFQALVLFDAERYDQAERVGGEASRRSNSSLARGIYLLSCVQQGQPPMHEMLRVVAAGNAELMGRAILVAEGRLTSLPRDVRRDVMDEIGIGWPGYAFLPPWLFKRSNLERRIWRLLASGNTAEASRITAEWRSNPEALSRGERESMIAAAIMADEWESASWWALTLEGYRRYVESGSVPKGLALFQLSLFRGLCLLMTGAPNESLLQFEMAGVRDSTSYLPHYFSAKAHNMLGDVMQARRGYVAACDRLNPSLASLRWEELLSISQTT